MLKLYSSVTYCATRCPSFSAGTKPILFAAATAFSVRPCGRALTMEIPLTSPVTARIARRRTVPVTLNLRACSVNPGSGFSVMIAFFDTSAGLKGLL